MVESNLQLCRAVADFEPHERSWILWPSRPDNWRDNARPAQTVFKELATAIVADEPLTIGVLPRHSEGIELAIPQGCKVVEMEYDDIWIRDTGPVFIDRNGEIAGVDWRFNSWGGGDQPLFGTWAKDDSVAQRVLTVESLPVVHSSVILEGGAIATNGRDTLLTTRECLLNPNRNKLMSEAEYEAVFSELLGTRKVIWLDEGLDHDEAGGHIDNVAAFLAPNMLLVADPAAAPTCQRARLKRSLQILQRSRDADGNQFELVLVPMPETLMITESEAMGFAPSDGAIQRRAGTPMAGSYINGVFTNTRLLVPCFDDPMDTVALNIIRDAAKPRTVAGIASRELVLGGGALHCVVLHRPTTRKGASNL